MCAGVQHETALHRASPLLAALGRRRIPRGHPCQESGQESVSQSKTTSEDERARERVWGHRAQSASARTCAHAMSVQGSAAGRREENPADALSVLLRWPLQAPFCAVSLEGPGLPSLPSARIMLGGRRALAFQLQAAGAHAHMAHSRGTAPRGVS